MENTILCEACGAVLSAGSSVCDECGAGEVPAPLPAVDPPLAASEHSPPPPRPRSNWLREIPGFRSDSTLERSLAIVGYLVILALLLSAISGNWLAFILGLDLLAIAFLATNAWGLRARLPLFGSSSPLKAAGGWFGLGLIALVAIWGNLPQGVTQPNPTSAAPPTGSATSPAGIAAKPGALATASAVTTPSTASLAALQAEIERNRKATATQAGHPNGVLAVGNTGGDGVSIRRTPAMDDRITAWPDGTAMTVVGEDRQAEGRAWKNVRDPAGNTGWVPVEYLVRPLATLAPPPSAAALLPARDDLTAFTEKVNGEMGMRFFEAVELRQGGAQLAVTVSDAWYELATHWKERTLEMLADAYATIAANRGLRGSAPGEANYPRTTFYDTFGKELGYKSADEVRVFR